MFCQCGCGKLTRICTHTSTSRGLIKGEPMRFLTGHNGVNRKRPTHCPQGHPLVEENIILSPSKGVSLRTGKPYRQPIKCRVCTKQISTTRRSTPEGKTERALEHLKSRGGLSAEELLRAKPLILEFFKRPDNEKVCPICNENCSGKKQFAADHDHETKIFRDVICQECNIALGNAREREDLLGNGKLWQYLLKHKRRFLCAHAG